MLDVIVITHCNTLRQRLRYNTAQRGGVVVIYKPTKILDQADVLSIANVQDIPRHPLYPRPPCGNSSIDFDVLPSEQEGNIATQSPFETTGNDIISGQACRHCPSCFFTENPAWDIILAESNTIVHALLVFVVYVNLFIGALCRNVWVEYLTKNRFVAVRST